MTEFPIEKPNKSALDAALLALEHYDDWGLTDQIQLLMFQDSTLVIHKARFVVDEEKSGWRMGPGSFPGVTKPVSFMVEGSWHFDYTATYDHGGTLKGSGTWGFGAELEEDTYPEVWFHYTDDACPGCGCRPGDGITAGCSHAEGCGHNRKMETAR